MSFSLVPQYSFREFTDISPGFLRKLGIRFLMLDLDNTIAAYSEHSPAESVKQWIADIKKNGIEMYFISNSKRKYRVEVFAEAFDIGYIKDARKPSPHCLAQAMETMGYSNGDSAFLGDQIFADTLAANRAGVISIVVRPISLKNPLLSLRYVIEAPFRTACIIKMRKEGL